MRRIFVFTSLAVGFASAVACATSDASAPDRPSHDDAPTTLPDAGHQGESPDSSKDAEAPKLDTCSAAGWCTTSLPDPDLTLTDIWPFETRAFAVAESPTQGVKVLEWDDAVQTWSYIDDDSQNTFESGRYSGKIWAPNENELYYGVAPAFIYHGMRSSPSAPWTWLRSRLDNHSRETGDERDPGLARIGPNFGSRASPTDYPALGVWGTSAADVYAWYANTIFRRTITEGGATTWAAEYTADDYVNASDAFFFFSAAGSSRDDVWFSGTRGRYANTGVFSCPMVVHKTAEGYRRLVDHTISGTSSTDHTRGSCAAKAGALNLKAFAGSLGLLNYTTGGWLTNIASSGPGSIAGIFQGRYFVYVTAEGTGTAMMTTVGVGIPRDDAPSTLNSIWIHETDAWMSGWGLVLRTDKDNSRWGAGGHLWSPTNAPDGGVMTVDVSTLALNGAPLDAPFHQVRGTSNTNLWAVGARYALHKTTP